MFLFFNFSFLPLGIDQTNYFVVILTKEGFTKIVNFLTSGQGFPGKQSFAGPTLILAFYWQYWPTVDK